MSKNSLDNIDAKLSEMLTNSTRVFDISMNALLGDTNLDSVRDDLYDTDKACLLYTSPSPRDRSISRMPSSA